MQASWSKKLIMRHLNPMSLITQNMTLNNRNEIDAYHYLQEEIA